MKRLFLMLMFLFLFCLPQSVLAEVDYRISSYVGELVIHEDNTADYTQTVTFHYDSSYRGQYVTLGSAGNLPAGFAIGDSPTVTATRNGEPLEPRVEQEIWQDGQQLKVYTGGEAGDEVVLIVVWHLSQLLFHFEDIAELNWIPISDWDVPLEEVVLSVKTDKQAEQQAIQVHRGYLKPDGLIDVKDDAYIIRATDVRNQLEIHAFWDSQILAGEPRLAGKGLEQYLKVEEEIVRKEDRLLLMIRFVLPVGGGVFLSLALLTHASYRRLTHPKTKMLRRIYELPEDASPLLVAKKVYNLSLSALSAQQKGLDVSFEQVLQATLLDLLDRKLIRLDEDSHQSLVSRTDRQGLTVVEQAFLDMAMGQADSLPLDQLFGDFVYDQRQEKRLEKSYKGSQLEKRMLTHANAYLRQFKSSLNGIDALVKDELQGLDVHYRQRTSQENNRFLLAQTLTGLAILISLVGGLMTLMYEQFTYLPFHLVWFVGALTLFFLALSAYQKDLTFGVPTALGQEALTDWNGFRLMLRDIKKFDSVELDSLVVWNRILVFATMFGSAKQVQSYMRLHHLSMPSETGLQAVTYHPRLFSSAIHQNLISSSRQATQTSHFSVPSSSGGVGGGFSGGGGGGGGGSF